MVDDSFHSYISINRFVSNKLQNPPSVQTLTSTSSSFHSASEDWPRLRRIIDRVHKHVCGHASFSYMRTLLLRNKLWTPKVQSYLVEKVTECTDCRASSTPPPNRRVSLSFLDRTFNEVVCIDHFFLDDHILFHSMDSATRYSAAHIVSSTSMHDAIYSFECIWLSQFWPPGAIHADGAFQTEEFEQFLIKHDIMLRPVHHAGIKKIWPNPDMEL